MVLMELELATRPPEVGEYHGEVRLGGRADCRLRTRGGGGRARVDCWIESASLQLLAVAARREVDGVCEVPQDEGVRRLNYLCALRRLRPPAIRPVDPYPGKK